MHAANGDIERGCPLRILRMSVVVSVQSVVSVSGVSVSGSTSPVHKEWTGAKEAGGVSRSRGQRDRGAARCRGAAVARRDRRRAGNLAPWPGQRDRDRSTSTVNGFNERTRTRVPLNVLSDLFHATHDRS